MAFKTDSLKTPAGGDNRAICYWDHDVKSWVLRASSLMDCTRALVAAGMGYDPTPFPPNMLKAFQAGNDSETLAKVWLAEQGVDVTRDQEEVEVKIGTAIVRGHIDGVVASEMHGIEGWSGEKAVLEVKSMNDSEFQRWGREGFAGWPKYAAQISVYMKGLGLPALYVVRNRGTGEYVTQFIPKAFPPMTTRTIVTKVREVVTFIESNQRLLSDNSPMYPNFPVCPGKKPGWCSYAYLHDAEESIERDDTLGLLAESYRSLSDEMSRLEKEAGILKVKREAIKVQLEAAMSNKSKLLSGTYRIKWQGMKTLDQSGLRGKYPEAYAEFQKDTRYLKVEVYTEEA